MAGVEYATGGERDFPEHWGTPPGEPFSETRSNWVKLNVAKSATLESHTRRLADLRNALYGSAATAREGNLPRLAACLSKLGDHLRP
jgi:hypothetical protein